MKKTLSLALVVLMVLSAFAVFTLSASAEVTAIDKYGEGIENWTGGTGGTQTQILICPKPWDGTVYGDSYIGKPVTLRMVATDGSTDDTFTVPVSSKYNGTSWGILRVEPCLIDIPWVPAEGVSYNLTATFEDTDGQMTTFTSAETFRNKDGAAVTSKEATKLGGYKYDGFAAHAGTLCFGYDFDFSSNPEPFKSVELKDSETATYALTVTKDGVSVRKPVEVVYTKSWGDDDNALFFDVADFGLEGGASYTARLDICFNDTWYYVEVTEAMEVPSYTPIDKDMSGTFEGSTVTWSIDAATKTLTIAGEGEMPDFADSKDLPYAASKPYIQKLVVKGTVTKTGKNMASKTGITEAIFEEGVERIGMDAIAYCEALTTVYLPKSLTALGQGIVYGSGAITAANYAGSETDWAGVDKSAPYNENILNNLVYNVPVPADVEPPVAGTMTVAFVVLAVVALFGTAVIVSKKVRV